MTLAQIPAPGSFNIFRCGDVFQLKLNVKNSNLTPHLRTSLGGAEKLRDAIVIKTEEDLTVSNNNWVDIPLNKIDSENYEISLPLYEVGYFEAKIWLKDGQQKEVIWAPGDNIHIKAEPASTVANNSIYGIFTRQFGPNKTKKFALNDDDTTTELENKGYHVIPPSGTFRNVIRELDHIMDTMGFRILQLLPIHPTPTTFARMGPFGSPYAALDFLSVDPALAEFDKQATPLDQFIELVDEVHRRNGELFLDIPVDHTGWASLLQKDHPEYFVRDTQGHFVSPGAWGNTWEDLIKLDFSNTNVRQMMADVFLFWCGKGVDGFRCDAGYMVPSEDWDYMVAKVRQQYPDTIFLLEGLGGPPEVTEQLLSKTTFSWAYSELFQNYDKNSVSYYMNEMLRITNSKGGMCNFSETHDNMRLAATSKTWSIMRNALCALTAPAGGFGISNGVEFLAEEKISVHHASGLNWNSEDNIVDLITRLTTLFKVHPAFYANAKIEIIDQNTEDVVVFKRTATNGDYLIIAINLNGNEERPIDYTHILGNTSPLTDLLSLNNTDVRTVLKPGEAHCIDTSDLYAERIRQYNKTTFQHPISRQQAKETLLKTHAHLHGFNAIPPHYVTQNLDLLLQDPYEFCINEGATPGQIIQYNTLSDPHRMVMATPNSILLLHSKEAFSYALKNGATNLYSGRSLRQKDKSYFALVALPQNETEESQYLDLSLTCQHKDKTLKKEGNIALLSSKDNNTFRQSFSLKECKERQLYAFCANESGSMSQISGTWGEYNSKYDSFFAVNMDPKVPVDRTALLSRLRCWVVHHEFSHELGAKSQYRFAADGASQACWSFKAPCGQGKYVLLDIQLQWDQTKNLASIHIVRQKDKKQDDLLDAKTAVTIIIRPDIEYRSNHEVTKAFLGAEDLFPQSISSTAKGFLFDPYKTVPFHLNALQGTFTSEAEWHYMQHLSVEQNRGLEHNTDFFSPGYFSLKLKENDADTLNASTDLEFKTYNPKFKAIAHKAVRDAVLKNSIRRFIVRRDEAQTVIAGYPWFLDWGRDTLICLRGIIAADMQQEAKEILLTFAKYEEEGTLPNMIRGNNASNRDTSDAPLWFIVAVKDYLEHFNDKGVLAMDCGGRSVLEVIKSIVNHYAKGTPNGIRMDQESALIYSPSHFTWMDTNYPAGTPREGYPIEIQAFWQAGVHFLSTIDSDQKWQNLAAKIKESILKYYPLSMGEGFSDCLHTNGFQKASEATKDNACRPNQLFAVTLGVISEKQRIKSIIMATQSLIVPGAIRSLKDAAVVPALPIYHDGHLLNNPEAPYWGRYEGDEDTRRKPAYHNGTGWAWPFFSYCEALYLYNGEKTNSLTILMSAKQEMEKGIINHMPEICDGNAPHQQRGCLAQAWSITEFYRVLTKIKS